MYKWGAKVYERIDFEEMALKMVEPSHIAQLKALKENANAQTLEKVSLYTLSFLPLLT